MNGRALWSPQDIAKECHKNTNPIFKRLTPQVLGGWFDKTARNAGVNKWSEATQKRVEQGHPPGGENMHQDILVCSH
jgi:hypothetical protein